MTTPHERLREAADNFREFANTGNDAHVSAEDCEIAANTLRALASAQSDAEKGFDEWWKDYWDEYFNEAGARHIYLAGHAQGYAAGLAAQEAKARELEVKINARPANQSHGELDVRWQELVAMHDDQMRRAQAAEAALATSQANALELANEVRRCHALAQEGHDAEWDDHCGQCDDVIDNRPASVTAAIERYK